MRDKVFAYIRQNNMIQPGTHVVAGISGGSDSVCMLRLLVEYRAEMPFDLTAVYVEHGIRGADSLEDGRFVRKLCRELDVPFVQEGIRVPEEAARTGAGIEETARRMRYGILKRIAAQKQPSVIATAHHAGDNAETVLFHLIRGSGLRGLGGIAPNRDGIIRPLLCLEKQEILAWLEREGQGYREDATNQDASYSRNRLRLQVLPELEAVNPAAVRHIAETCGIIREAQTYLDQLCDTVTGQLTRTKGAAIYIDREAFLALSPFLQKEMAYRLLGRAAGSCRDIGRVHIEALIGLFFAQSGSRADLPGQLEAETVFDRVRLQKKVDGAAGGSDPNAGFEAELPVPGKVRLPDGRMLYANYLNPPFELSKIPKKRYTKWLDCDKISCNLSVRSRRAGDYLCIGPDGGRKLLKKYLMEEKIPAGQRDRIALVADGSHILWTIGGRISERVKVTESTRRILELHVES